MMHVVVERDRDKPDRVSEPMDRDCLTCAISPAADLEMTIAGRRLRTLEDPMIINDPDPGEQTFSE
jgi:hypothetical protein